MSGPKGGDSPDESRLFGSLYSELRAFAAVVGFATDDPDDLVQEALVRVLAGPGLSNLESPRAYMKKIVLNLAADRARGRVRRDRALTRLAPEAHFDHHPSDLALLDILSPHDRALLYLADVEGYTLREAADQLGLSHQAARLRASRSRRLLKRRLDLEEKR